MSTKLFLRGLLVFSTMGLLAGCSGDADRSLSELRTIALESCEGTVAARKGKDPRAARKLSKRASAVAALAGKKLAALETPADEQKKIVNEIASAAKSAELTANLAEEDAHLARKLRSLKSKGYLGGRKLLVKGIFLGLSYSAKKVEEKGIDALPEKVRARAECGADLVYEYTSLEKGKDDAHDWGKIAEALEKMAVSPPHEIAAMLAATYLVTAQRDLALYEIESLDLSSIADRDRKLICQIIRAATLSCNGYGDLSVEYMRATLDEHKEANVVGNLKGTENTLQKRDDPEEMLGVLHLGLALVHLKAKRYAEADREAANATRVWPNNPLTVFLTGELLLAEGKKEEAAESLETAAAGSEYEWLAEVIAERAREIRDGKDSSQSLVYNARIIAELVTRTVLEKAKHSPQAEKLGRWLSLRRSFGRYFSEKKQPAGADHGENPATQGASAPVEK